MASALATKTSIYTGNDRNANVRWLSQATLLAVSDPTTTYAPTDYVDCRAAQSVAAELALVHTDGTSFEWYYEWSPDATNWYRDMNKATSGATDTVTARIHTYTAAASAKFVDLLTVKDVYFRVQIQRTGGAATNTAGVTVTLLGL